MRIFPGPKSSIMRQPSIGIFIKRHFLLANNQLQIENSGFVRTCDEHLLKALCCLARSSNSFNFRSKVESFQAKDSFGSIFLASWKHKKKTSFNVWSIKFRSISANSGRIKACSGQFSVQSWIFPGKILFLDLYWWPPDSKKSPSFWCPKNRI